MEISALPNGHHANPLKNTQLQITHQMRLQILMLEWRHRSQIALR